jgi:ankyrin repeat protein
VGTIEALRLTHAHFGTDLIRRVASAIERCASSGKTATLQFMIEHLGFDAKHVNPHTRRNLLHDALEGGNEEGARYLIALDIPMHWQDTNGSTPLHLAGHGASADCIRLYAGKQTDNNKVDEWQQTALHRAAIVCRRNHLEVVRALLDVGLDLDAVDAEGDTALHCAAHYANLDMVLALLQCGANPCVLNARGMTAERLANLAHTQTYMNPDAASRPEETQRLIECYRTIELRLKRVTNEGR